MPNDITIIEQTKNWINSFVVEYNLCPFAQRVIEKDSLHLAVIHADTFDVALEAFMAEILHLENNNHIETSLLIFPTLLPDFYDYLDLAALAETLMYDQGYEGVYQLATFHPDYCFAGVDAADVSNYTNRSPYPMLHILRETSLDAAIKFYGDTEHIPEKNIATLRELELENIKKIVD